jgi:N-acetyl-beta-hexosaminidase
VCWGRSRQRDVHRSHTHEETHGFLQFNRLHWHIVDDQSWPLISKKYPRFTVGALAPHLVYTPEDVSSIVQYAYERGVTVFPELDLPAHARAWGKGYPELVVSCPGGQTLIDPRDTPGGIYDVVDALLEVRCRHASRRAVFITALIAHRSL